MDEKMYDWCIGDTNTEDINNALKNKYDVIKQITDALLSDCDNDSKILLEMYLDADKKERAIMDATIVCVCGYTMSSIINLCEKNETVLE